MKENAHFLYPATLYVSKSPAYITTVLGSCVAVCLWDSVNNIGGMNHYMLPFWNGDGLASPKYGNIAIHKLYEKVTALGAEHRYIIAKIFGGGHVLNTKTNNSTFDIGYRNIELAEKMLDELNVPIVKHSVGGRNGRKIRFNTFTGEVLLKMINQTIPYSAR